MKLLNLKEQSSINGGLVYSTNSNGVANGNAEEVLVLNFGLCYRANTPGSGD